MKKLLLIIALLISALGLNAQSVIIDNLEFTVTSETPAECEISGYSGKPVDVTIPSTVTISGKEYTVTSIGDYAFSWYSSLTSIEFEENSMLTSIGDMAFYYCSSLTSIELPSGVTFIGNGAFGDCSSLTSIVVESGNTVYDSRDNCNAIIETATNTLIAGCKNTVIPNSVTSIGDDAFYCSSLTSIEIPSGVTSIGRYAFSGCYSLTSIEIPSGVTSIGEAAFSGCYSLTSIIVESGNTVYDSRYNCNAIIETATNTLIAGCQNTVIPSSVTSIGEDAFSGCSSLTSIELPNSVTSIGEAAFYYCSSLTSIEIPSGVTSIGRYAFSGCYSLTSIEIPSGVTSIGEAAFSGCSSLTSIYCYAESVPETDSDAFYNCPSDMVIYVPEQSVGAYKAASPWNNYTIMPLTDNEDPEELTPVVEIEVKNVTPLSVEVAFTPAGECASYYILLDTEASMEMWAAVFGVTLEQLVEVWSIERSGPLTHLWNENIIPNTEYTIFVLSKDIEGEVIQLDKKKVTTLSLGGEGVSVIDLQVEVLTNTSVFVTATPNEETAEYHYILIEKSYADSIGVDSTMKIIHTDPYALYDIDRWEWIDLHENTEFYAIAQGKNAQGEWGEITKVEFVTTVDEDEEEGEDPETPVDPEEPGDEGEEEGEDPEELTPVVEIEVKNVTPLSVEVAFTPAGECASYYILLDTEASMEQWATAFGVTLEQLIEEWSIERSGPSTNLWNENIIPNTEYTIFVLSKDIEGEVIQLDKKKVTTLSLGGEGVSVIDLQVEVTSNTSAFVTATPNEETAEYHYILIEKSYADSIGVDSTMKIIYEDPYTLYEIDRWEWIGLNANTEFYAIAQGKNAQGEWGEITKVEFVTTVDEDEEEGEDPETPVDPEQPNQPTDSLVLSVPALAVDTVTETTVVLVWNAINSATSYNVYMDSVLVKNVTDTIYTVDSLISDSTYNFMVTAVADTLESEFSNVVTVTTLKAEGEEPEQPENPEEPGDEPEEPIELDAPENVEATATSTSSIIITWDKVENALSYNIYRDGELLDDTENTNYTDKDLEYNTEYCYTIEAVNGKETSDESEEVCVKTLGEGVEELTSSFNIYPNPVSDKLYIETLTQTQTVEIYDVYGRLQVTETPSHQGNLSIDVTSLNSGVYFVKVVTNEGDVVKRFVKK